MTIGFSVCWQLKCLGEGISMAFGGGMNLCQIKVWI